MAPSGRLTLLLLAFVMLPAFSYGREIAKDIHNRGHLIQNDWETLARETTIK
jgi:hypothetical protein